MKAVRFLCLAFFVCSLMAVYAVSTQAAPQTPAGKVEAPMKVQPKSVQFNCAKDASGTTICKRTAPAGKTGGVYTDKAATKGRACRWKCTMEQGVEVCRGSGNECNGKVPPHWVAITR